tara:strand:- start:126 stop:2747 length:2622 start_codon:yes stop_codon:yes gene_type:complete
MEFCDICNNRLDATGRCFTCDTNEVRKSFQTERKYQTRKRNSTSGKSCFRCGAAIYFDNKIKSESGKFIPVDKITRKPHICGNEKPTENLLHSRNLHTFKKFRGKSGIEEPKANTSEEPKAIEISENVLFNIKQIPKGDRIVDEIVKGHKEGQIGIIHYEYLKAPEPPTIPVDNLSDVLHPSIISGLKQYGFSGVLEFQDKSIRTIISGKNTIISAPTGSGKTEAFTIPILQKILEKKSVGTVAVFVYPLNALIDDQVSKIKRLIEKCGLEDTIAGYAIHGGQSSRYKDGIIAESAKKSLILATNFDFINYHLILQDKKWKQLFKPARILVLDEAHSYTSFHGSNVYHVVKRMKNYMQNLQYIGSSATLDNSKGFFSNMFDLQENEVEYVKSKHRRKQNMHRFFIMPRKFGQRMTMQKITSVCYKNNSKQLVFGNTHSDVEFLATNLEDSNRNMRIEVHRGGLNPRDKRKFEGMMKRGELDVLSCTPTLELGIDIGQVDVATSAFKNEFDSFIQRTGRAGRRGQTSYAFCVFDPDDASCHYYSRKINEYTNQKHEVNVNKDNPIISEKHQKAISVEQISARSFDKKQFWEFAGSMNLRGTSGNVKIILDGIQMAERNLPSGYYELHKGALYHYNRKVYEVDSLRKTQTGGTAIVNESNERNKRTVPVVLTSLKEVKETEKKSIEFGFEQSEITYGMIEIDRVITGYYKGEYNKLIEEMDLIKGEDIPNWYNFLWSSKHLAVGILLPKVFVDSAKLSDNLRDIDPGIHTVIHVLSTAAKIVTKAEPGDIDAIYENGVIYLYDNTADGANGCSQIVFNKIDEILEISRNLLSECNCHYKKDEEWAGCQKCTFTTSYCRTKNKKLSKQIAMGFFGL